VCDNDSTRHGTVLYNKGLLHLACVARAEIVDFKICTQDGTVIFQNRMDKGASINGGDYYIFYKEIDAHGLVPDTDYYVTYWYEDDSKGEPTVIFNAFVYRPSLSMQYSDYPFQGNWATYTTVDSIVGNSVALINTNTNNRSNEIKADIKTSYLGNKKLEMTYCETVPSPNPRNLFVGCEDYITEIIKADSHSDWATPISTKIVYYWYDADKKRIKVGEE
jgi:hypothetical protein